MAAQPASMKTNSASLSPRPERQGAAAGVRFTKPGILFQVSGSKFHDVNANDL
jgi:hypothetical protein